MINKKVISSKDNDIPVMRAYAVDALMVGAEIQSLEYKALISRSHHSACYLVNVMKRSHFLKVFLFSYTIYNKLFAFSQTSKAESDFSP